MSKELINGIAALGRTHDQECDDFIAGHQPHPSDRRGPAVDKTVTELDDQCLQKWADHCANHVVDADMEYLRAANARTYYFMQLQDAERELARRRRG